MGFFFADSDIRVLSCSHNTSKREKNYERYEISFCVLIHSSIKQLNMIVWAKL